ncbi:LysM peptidoglycan-binding domain-containing protein [Actinomadura sp. 21ATH]|uniref:LysM peptidoglycan-binding domain-containing protein n=1 Tax=Actinomadura sp. 21ATH TaxID=1735444 RepID=UPI0035C21A2C
MHAGHDVERAAEPPPLRLTRRGRGVLVGTVATGLLVTFWLTAGLGASAGDGTERPAQRMSDEADRGGQGDRARTVVVEPGETLWEIASRDDPDGDPRVTVRRIIDLNGLAGTFIQPGQELRMPAR